MKTVSIKILGLFVVLLLEVGFVANAQFLALNTDDKEEVGKIDEPKTGEGKESNDLKFDNFDSLFLEHLYQIPLFSVPQKQPLKLPFGLDSHFKRLFEPLKTEPLYDRIEVDDNNDGISINNSSRNADAILYRTERSNALLSKK